MFQWIKVYGADGRTVIAYNLVRRSAVVKRQTKQNDQETVRTKAA